MKIILVSREALGMGVTSSSKKEPFVSVIAADCKYGRSSIGISVCMYH
jgi:hypothetical protein